MAIIKHSSSKNANYGQILEYLSFEHDANTGKVLHYEIEIAIAEGTDYETKNEKGAWADDD